uniref:Uncharacterized protein n=1 Tax=Scophthalmus maximus TaxID=52904 RepID=A0A8D3AMB1_SCOMX
MTVGWASEYSRVPGLNSPILAASFSARHPRTAVVFLCFAGLRASCCATAELRLNMSDSFCSASWRRDKEDTDHLLY